MNVGIFVYSRTGNTRKDLTEQIIQAQSSAIDVVSGATTDKKAFLKSVENALESAQPKK